MPQSSFRAMWLLVMFDLPVRTKGERKAAAEFRKLLIRDGFSMIQLSCYLRPCPTDVHAESHASRVRGFLPPKGQVRILRITDRQFALMECFLGKLPFSGEQRPQQLEFF